ncbi:CDP-alcohol phosphatidyltransferase family protein [Uliginosibacterium sediminicola]|uniref:CDP-alcohol phosphatidyltransferase family protein n=1 Tax=Uliginosibacterium sediminicola TaxID=2024550 RepID=A0ABU9YUJ9_9RHOO
MKATQLPLLLTALRAALAPLLLWLAWFWPDPAAFAGCLLIAFLSDVFDGVIARRLGVATVALRRLDSIADSVFYVAAMCAVWHLHPAAITEHPYLLGTLLALELARYLFDFIKFRREAAYHMWSSKLWGIGLFAGFLGILAGGNTGWAVWLAALPGILADIEGLAISAILPQWRNDVPSVLHAWRLRQTLQATKS